MTWDDGDSSMKIYLLRHGKAEDPESVGGSDKARRLTDIGIQETEVSARAIERMQVCPEVIWTSPYPRAAQTAEIVADRLGLGERLRQIEVLEPGARPEPVMEMVESANREQSVMLVGHNPDLETLLAYLVSKDGSAKIKLKKGALAFLEAKGPLKAGSGKLMGLWTVQDLHKLLGGAGE